MFLYQVPEPWRHLIYAENSRQSSHLATSIDFRDFGWQQRYARFCGRVVVLSILSVLLYPFLWVWTVIGTLWFSSAKNCVSFACLDVSRTGDPVSSPYLTVSFKIVFFF